MKREAKGIYSMIMFQGQDTDFHPEQCQLKKKKTFLMSFCLLFTKGHRNQSGSAAGHGAPRFTHHGRDFHRAREEVETRRHGWKVGAPGSGSVFSHHFNGAWQMLSEMWLSVIIKNGTKVSWGSQESVSGDSLPGEYVLYFTVSYNTIESV